MVFSVTSLRCCEDGVFLNRNEEYEVTGVQYSCSIYDMCVSSAVGEETAV